MIEYVSTYRYNVNINNIINLHNKIFAYIIHLKFGETDKYNADYVYVI